MLKVSSGYTKRVLGPHAFADIFDRGAIYIYGDTRPGSANDEPGSPPVGIATHLGMAWNPINFGYGLRFVLQDQYVLFRTGIHPRIVPFAVTNAIWARLVAPGDSGGASFDDPRIDCDIGIQSEPRGEELLVLDRALTPGTNVPFEYLLYTILPIPGA